MTNSATQPVSATTTSPTSPPPTLASTSGAKKPLLIIGTLIAFILLAAGIAFAAYQSYWNSDQKILLDAWVNTSTSKTSTAKGNFQLLQDTGFFSYQINLDFATQNSLDEQSFTGDLSFSFDEFNGSLKGELLHPISGEFYGKISGLSELIQSFANEYPDLSSLTDYLELSLIDNQWLYLSQAEVEEYLSAASTNYPFNQEETDSLQTCLQQKFRQIQSDKALQTELAQIIYQSGFITAQAGNPGPIAGQNAIPYTITFNAQKLPPLTLSLLQSQAYASLKTCAPDPEIMTDFEAELQAKLSEAADLTTVEIEQFNQVLPQITIWINRQTHTLAHLDLKANLEDSFNFTATIDFTFNEPLTFTPPANARPLTEVIEQIQKQIQASEEPRTMALDQENLDLAYRYVQALESYATYYQSYPWTVTATNAFLFDPWADVFNDWVEQLVSPDGYGLTESEADELSYSNFYVFKPQGPIATTRTHVCFEPDSISFKQYAAQACLNNSRSYLNFDPCPNEAGEIVDGEWNQDTFTYRPGNLICVTSNEKPITITNIVTNQQ